MDESEDTDHRRDDASSVCAGSWVRSS